MLAPCSLVMYWMSQLGDWSFKGGGGWQYFHTCLFQLAKVTEEQKRTEKEDTVNTINMPVYGQTVKAW